MALAIQTVAHRVKLKYKEKTVQDFRYRDKEWEQLFLDALSNVTFEGVTVGDKVLNCIKLTSYIEVLYYFILKITKCFHISDEP